MQPARHAPGAQRFDAIDLLRGLVIALMTVDHASGAFNAGRFMQDSAAFWTPGSPLPTQQFLLRWITHLCAPTFVFLAGTSVALSSRSRLARGQSERSIDAALLKRGAFIALVDPLWMSLAFLGYSGVIFQVMYALGVSMMLMAALRKLSARALLTAALAFSLLGELCIGLGVWASGGERPWLPVALLLSGGQFALPFPHVKVWIIAYPILPWLTLMVFGYLFGLRLLDESRRPTVVRQLLLVAAALLAIFVAVRGANGYGNLRLLREGPELLQWLHVSKYPPSLSYVTLELGLAALLLALLVRVTRNVLARVLSPLRTLGQASLFFYLLHAHLLGATAMSLGMHKQGGIRETLIASLATLILLYPCCVFYVRYKQAHPDGLARYV
jgi:uncharacterized membrane protein